MATVHKFIIWDNRLLFYITDGYSAQCTIIMKYYVIILPFIDKQLKIRVLL